MDEQLRQALVRIQEQHDFIVELQAENNLLRERCVIFQNTIDNMMGYKP